MVLTTYKQTCQLTSANYCLNDVTQWECGIQLSHHWIFRIAALNVNNLNYFSNTHNLPSI